MPLGITKLAIRKMTSNESSLAIEKLTTASESLVNSTWNSSFQIRRPVRHCEQKP